MTMRFISSRIVGRIHLHSLLWNKDVDVLSRCKLNSKTALFHSENNWFLLGSFPNFEEKRIWKMLNFLSVEIKRIIMSVEV